MPLSLLEQQKICSTLPVIHDRKLLSELASRGIKLADVGRDSPPIRVLLGADILGSILTGRIEWESEGIIETVPIDQLAKEVHYLPHRPVIRPSSNTTKVRPIFDASSKKPGFASLN
ncbi:uncharacterized protein TNCV_4791631 [Trichonephila clavipes]|nr:uncharacterized protein TNCV_4791631 [Trichonephila clavipes]